MQLDESELKRLISAILSAIRSEEILSLSPDKEISVVFSAPWDCRFYTFAEEMKVKKGCIFRGYLSPELPNGAISRLREAAEWASLEVWNYARLERLSESVSVFPVTRRDTIVKTALCISDTFETKWIRAAMEQGGKIILPRSGFERFTGFEPEKYTKRMLSYLRDLLEMNIELPESFDKYTI